MNGVIYSRNTTLVLWRYIQDQINGTMSEGKRLTRERQRFHCKYKKFETTEKKENIKYIFRKP